MKVFTVTLDNVHKPLELAKNNGKKSGYVEQWVSAPEKNAKEVKKGGKKAEPEASVDDPDEEDPEIQDSVNAPAIDPIRAETLNIAADLIALRAAPEAAKMAKAKE